MIQNYCNSLYKTFSYSTPGYILLISRSDIDSFENLDTHVYTQKKKIKIYIPLHVKLYCFQTKKTLYKSHYIIQGRGRIGLIWFLPTIMLLGPSGCGKTSLLEKLTNVNFNLPKYGWAHYRDIIVPYHQKLYLEISSYRYDFQTQQHFYKYFQTWNIKTCLFFINSDDAVDLTRLDKYNISLLEDNNQMKTILFLIKYSALKFGKKIFYDSWNAKVGMHTSLKYKIYIYKDDISIKHIKNFLLQSL